MYVLDHPYLRIGGRGTLTHESEAAPEDGSKTQHDLLENVAEGDVREEPVTLEIVIAIVVTVGKAT